MTITISIEAPTASAAREEMARLLGTTTLNMTFEPRPAEKRDTFIVPEVHEAVLDDEGRATGETHPIDGFASKHNDAAGENEVVTAPKRERGKPSPGRARRTKEEIAEDEAAEKADNEAYANAAQGEALAGKGAISETPEDRQDPNNPDDVDPPEVAAQDAADEAAETAAASTGKLTLDDVRNTLALYVKAYGMPAAQEDGPRIISSVCGEGKVKVSDITDDQIGAVIDAIKAAGKANTYDRVLLVQS